MTGPLLFYGALYYYTNAPDFKLAWTLMIAGGAGNLLSYFYPPFGVVDFVSMKMFGDQNVVFNFADVCSSAASVLAVVLIVMRIVKFFIGRSRSKPQSAS